MATFMGQTVDIYEDFEDATLETGLSETDADGRLTINSTGRYMAGTHSMAVDMSSGTTAKIVYTLASSSSVSCGFWYYTSNWAANGKEMMFFNFTGGGASHNCVTLYDQQSWAGVRNIAYTEFAAGINVADATWYWVTIKWEAGVGATLRLYDTSHNQVGSDITTTGSGGDYHADSIDSIDVGERYTFNTFVGTINVDDYVIDETSMLWPILGWTTGGGGVSLQKYASYYNRKRSS